MKVILNKDVANLGEEGDIKDVARGYARNFLIPQKLVMPYLPESLAILESRRETIEQRKAEKAKAAMDVKARLEAEPLVLVMPAGESGRLFGSVTSATIVDALAQTGVTVERKRIDIPEKTIKSVGTTRVRVRLYGDEEAELRVVVNAAGGTAATTDADEAAETDAAEAVAAGAVSDDEAEATAEAAPDNVAEVAEPSGDEPADVTSDEPADVTSDEPADAAGDEAVEPASDEPAPADETPVEPNDEDEPGTDE